MISRMHIDSRGVAVSFTRPPLPPYTFGTAVEKVRLAEADGTAGIPSAFRSAIPWTATGGTARSASKDDPPSFNF
jgi:hypothetical protein